MIQGCNFILIFYFNFNLMAFIFILILKNTIWRIPINSQNHDYHYDYNYDHGDESESEHWVWTPSLNTELNSELYLDLLLDDLCFFFFLCSRSLSLDFFEEPIFYFNFLNNNFCIYTNGTYNENDNLINSYFYLWFSIWESLPEIDILR